ncbi:ATP-dependent Clp protease proteolytic subunit [Patescibacteria group bacterium]|nr:ATP-dependent Clp protease proteolytic subunit [Patescibacteria group bacterium]
MDEKSLKQAEPSIFFARLVGNIEDDTVKETVEELNIANAKSYVTQISFTLVSYGGDLLYSFALYDHIKASVKPVDIIVEGMCMSSAVMVLQAGRRRIARPHTVFMVHPTITSLEEKTYPEFISIVDQFKKNHDLFVNLSIERSGMSREEFEKIYAPRKYLTPEEALHFGKHGLIDEICEQ